MGHFRSGFFKKKRNNERMLAPIPFFNMQNNMNNNLCKNGFEAALRCIPSALE